MSDQARFDAAFRAHHDAVLRFLVRRTDGAAAEDLLAETFLIAWRKRADVPDDPLPWLYAVARNVVANHYRSTGREAALRGRIEDAERGRAPHDPGGARTGGSGDLAVALRSLRPDDRDVLMLHAWEGLDRTAAARVLGCLPATYSVRLHRARRRLRAALDTAERAASVPTRHAPEGELR